MIFSIAQLKAREMKLTMIIVNISESFIKFAFWHHCIEVKQSKEKQT